MTAETPAPSTHRQFRPPAEGIEKSRTWIEGFDEITGGGIPRGRVTLLLGGPGAGKTVFALETLVNGARRDCEPGIFIAFEESSKQLIANAATFGWDLEGLQREGLFFLDARLSPSVVQAGDFDLAGMLAGVGAKAKEMGATRIVLDGIDVLLTLLDNPVAERREMYRIYEWLQLEGLTALITGKATETDRPSTERYAFMQFMVDCVVLFRHRLADRVSIRTVRVLKYRGSGFSENEFPLVISQAGIRVATFVPQSLSRAASTARISTGVARLDNMLEGGYYEGSAILISGAPGTAKTTLAAACAEATCLRGEAALVMTFDEGPSQYVRNLKSVGIDLEPHVRSGNLIIASVRTESQGAEEHLLDLKTRIATHQPTLLVIDPISALAKTGGAIAASHASVRVMDHAKGLGITTIVTSLISAENAESETTATQISTIADTWIHLAYLVKGGERNRTLTVVKSRGTAHSSQVRELLLSRDGISLADVYTAGGEVLVGTARWQRELEEANAERTRVAKTRQRRAQLALAEADVAARISALERELEAHRAEAESTEQEELARQRRRRSDAATVIHRRTGDSDSSGQRTPDRSDESRS